MGIPDVGPVHEELHQLSRRHIANVVKSALHKIILLQCFLNHKISYTLTSRMYGFGLYFSA